MPMILFGVTNNNVSPSQNLRYLMEADKLVGSAKVEVKFVATKKPNDYEILYSVETSDKDKIGEIARFARDIGQAWIVVVDLAGVVSVFDVWTYKYVKVGLWKKCEDLSGHRYFFKVESKNSSYVIEKKGK